MKRFFVLATIALGVAVVLGCRNAGRNDAPSATSEPRNSDSSSLDPKLEEHINDLIKQLGDDDIERRDAAQAELIKIGKPALALVEMAMNESDDPEVNSRCEAVAGEIKRHVMTLIGKNEQGYEEYRHEMIGMVFVKVPGGTFKMGSENGGDNEKPAHEVKLDGFLIAKYEVTQAVWQKVMGKNPSYSKGDDNPVECVSWDDCRQFCEKTGLRLPTEAEWEYACRSGTGTKFYWGDDSNGDYMWYVENSDHTTHPVGYKRPNAFGLFDMSGNVWEWCQDWYGGYAAGPQDNPTGPETGDCRVLRGGGWGRSDSGCRSSDRYWSTPDYRDCRVGVRVVADLPR